MSRTREHFEQFKTQEQAEEYIASLKAQGSKNGWRYDGWWKQYASATDTEGFFIVHIVWEGDQQDQTLLADNGFFTEPVPGQPDYVQPGQAQRSDPTVDWLVAEVTRQRREIDDLNKNVARMGGRVTGRAPTPYPGTPMYTPGRTPAPRPWSA